MRWQQRQARVEDAVYDAMDELSDLLSIPIKYYPEVRWLGRTVKFNDLLLPESRRQAIEYRMRKGISCFLNDQNIVLIARKDINPYIKDVNKAILEESSHAFHFISSGLSYQSRQVKDAREYVYLPVLVEMVGFLGARLIGMVGDDPFADFPDLVVSSESELVHIKQAIEITLGGTVDFHDFFVHQQGYGLAERIYYKHLSGDVPLSRIRRLFLSKFSQPGGATSRFIQLRNEFWPVEAEVCL